MTAKKYTLLFFLLSVVVLGIGARQLTTSLTRETVIVATDRYAFSSHANQDAGSFTNWDNNDPPLIPARCAKCHSTPGFLDFLGEDGSAPGVVDQDAPTGTVITCNACHNPSAHRLEVVAFHSSAQVEPSGSEAVCLNCHQSLQSTIGVEKALEGLADDEVDAELGFINPHFKFAASVQYGSMAQSGYEYPGEAYAGFFYHASGASTCTDCHNPHSQAVEPKQCAICHVNVVTASDFINIRMQRADFDGDSNISQGIYTEIVGLSSMLLSAIQEYAQTIAETPVVYANQSPYFFIDTNANGSADEDEINFQNRYDAWTPRLVRAAYNYQFAQQDAAGYVHNPRYVIQLLHDSLSDLTRVTRQTEIDLPRP